VETHNMGDDHEVSGGVNDLSAVTFERAAEELRRQNLQQPRRGLAMDFDLAAATSPPPRTSQHRGGGSQGDVPPAAVWWPAVSAAERERERERARVSEEQETPVVPPGYRRVPEEERRRTLSDLEDKLAKLDARYAQLPLKIETEGQRRAQKMLRAKIKETEAAVQLFSRPSGVLLEI
jgi:hypothetical protein